ncbi:MAG: 4-hydroxybenzoate octaprenyltransferase [Nitrospiraceae bacterium]
MAQSLDHSSRLRRIQGIPWQPFIQLIRLRNQSGTLLLMLPTLWSLTLATQGRPSIGLLVIFIIGSFLMRSAGVVLNDVVDRSFDRQVTRTRERPLASGQVTVPQALAVTALLVLLAAALVLLLHPLAIRMSPMGLLLAVLYPYSKRFLRMPQAVLGLAFGWGVVMAWAAARGSLDPSAWLLYASTLCWAIAYDTVYALQDRDDDARIGVKSSALLFGSWTWLAVAILLAMMVLLLAAAGRMVGIGVLFYVVLAAVGGFFVRQVLVLRGPVSAQSALTMFRQHVWAGWAILTGIGIGFWQIS